ncbi:MAG: NAD(P)-dependent oxidoreductase [Alphaproteobacteria bacterium]|nr:NAD(P)-dependent oxidoreductase [Alphaproteobacteria bacterium]
MHTAFIGLGVMGYPMAGHLARNGHDVVVFNRTNDRAVRWVGEYGGGRAASPAEAARGAELVMACVGRDDDLRAITLSETGAFSTMRPGSVFVDHTTASASVARELARTASQKGIGYVDAPVSGGEQGAQKGQLTIMCGGSERDYAEAEPVISTYAKQCRRMGPVGAGQLTKMVNQICLAGLIESLAEGLNFARAAGLDPQAVVDVISKGAAQSWQMDNRHRTMLAGHYEHGFAVEWMRKDLSICLAEAQRNGTSLPVVELVDSFYGEIEAMGGKRWDTSSLFARLEVIRKG